MKHDPLCRAAYELALSLALLLVELDILPSLPAGNLTSQAILENVMHLQVPCTRDNALKATERVGIHFQCCVSATIVCRL